MEELAAAMVKAAVAGKEGLAGSWVEGIRGKGAAGRGEEERAAVELEAESQVG